MARGGYVLLDVDDRAVQRNLDIVVDRVGRGTKKATTAMVQEIYEESQKQVPKDTHTLASSGYWIVEGNYKTGFTGFVGYGGNGDPINPKNNKVASSYMVEVHEDLSVHHKNGKAKFLEDPVMEYHSKVGARASQFIREEF